MNEIILYNAPTKALRLIALSSIFVLPGCYSIYLGKSDFLIFLIISFFSLGYIVGFFRLLDRRSQIIINEKGIWDRSLKLDVIPWKYIRYAYAITIYKQDFISLVTAKEILRRKKNYKWTEVLNKRIRVQKINLNFSALNADSQSFNFLILRLIKASQEDRNVIINQFKEK